MSNYVRPLNPGQGMGVARRTVFRPSDDGKWANVAKRVAQGNRALLPEYEDDKDMEKLIGMGAMLMSGRHLQHGDVGQKDRNMELYTNCSTGAFSFMEYYLLLNGSGVGRCYDDDVMLVDWQAGPNVQLALSSEHPDFPRTPEAVRQVMFEFGLNPNDPKQKEEFEAEIAGWAANAVGKYVSGSPGKKDVEYRLAPQFQDGTHVVADSRRGWAQALEVWEVKAFDRSDDMLIMDFSSVRGNSEPIGGMQDRPASGPLSPMRGFWNLREKVVKAPKMSLWKQSMFVDHFQAAEVQVGGARRAARIATKYWKDPEILDFIAIKANCGLWSANNSVGVCGEFWDALAAKDSRAQTIFYAVIDSLWENGEPGFINLHNLDQGPSQRVIADEDIDGAFRSSFFVPTEHGHELIKATLTAVFGKKFQFIVNPCAEIALHLLGAYCVIGDVALLLAYPGDIDGHMNPMLFGEWDENVKQAVAITARALVRVNQMEAFYGQEVRRTNRIGVGLTGIHEYAWARFGLTFRDLLTEKADGFWARIEELSQIAKDAANNYSDHLGLERPHTVTTIKPSGSVSKLFALTEGAHLPSFRYVLRWVQYRGGKDEAGNWLPSTDPLVIQKEKQGYPVRVLSGSYRGSAIVGYPTAPLFASLGCPDIVTAPEASAEEQYKYLMLLEKHWIGEHQGNQVSYTMKLYTNQVDKQYFSDMVAKYQPQIRCCSVMPSKHESEMGYEYLPEEEIDVERFVSLSLGIDDPDFHQDIDVNTLLCAGGACPL